MPLRRILLVALLGISGCAPVLSQSLIDSSEPRIPFGEIRKSPDRHVGKTVIVGGTVIQVMQENGYHLVEVLQRPLGTQMQPLDRDVSGGRFLARIKILGAETALKKNRPITLGGKVVGKETRPLDRMQYTYPVIEVEDYHLWRIWRADPGTAPRFFWSFGMSGNL